MFKEKTRRNMEIYVDDLLIKIRESRWQTDDLGEVFIVL